MRWTIQEILRAGLARLLTERKLPGYAIRAAWALLRCCTAALGGHAKLCPAGHVEGVWYNTYGLYAPRNREELEQARAGIEPSPEWSEAHRRRLRPKPCSLGPPGGFRLRLPPRQATHRPGLDARTSTRAPTASVQSP